MASLLPDSGSSIASVPTPFPARAQANVPTVALASAPAPAPAHAHAHSQAQAPAHALGNADAQANHGRGTRPYSWRRSRAPHQSMLPEPLHIQHELALALALDLGDEGKTECMDDFPPTILMKSQRRNIIPQPNDCGMEPPKVRYDRKPVLSVLREWKVGGWTVTGGGGDVDRITP